MEQPQVDLLKQFPNIAYIDWDRFLSSSPYRTEIMNEYITPLKDYAKSVQAEMALVNELQSYLVRVFSFTPYQAYLLWEHYVAQYRRVQVQLVLSKIENAPHASLKVSRSPNA